MNTAEQHAIFRDAVLAYELRCDAQALCFVAGLALVAGQGGVDGMLDDALEDMKDAAGLDGGADD